MSTSTVGAGVVDTAGSVTTEKTTYRTYVKYGTENVKDSVTGEVTAKTTITEIQAKAETAKKDKDTGVSANWVKAEKDGFSLLTENEVIRYTVKSKAGIDLLVPDEAQQIYIFQSGLNYLQNSKANAIAVALKENTPEPEPEYSNATIDLREAINEPPSRRSLSEIDKLVKLLTAMGVPANKQAEVIATMLAAKASAEPEEVEEEVEIS
jgi:cysteinyl-tRNA synthetase